MFIIQQQNIFVFVVLLLNDSSYAKICKSGLESNHFLRTWMKKSMFKCEESSSCAKLSLYGSPTTIVQVREDFTDLTST